MSIYQIGLLHPGEMGISVAASAQKSGHNVYWVSEGRSLESRERARTFELIDAQSLATLCATCQIIISVCPPDAAEAVAESVLAQGFTGLYVDANAISPQRVLHISERMTRGGARFVDGGIVGRPAWEANSTWLYLSGEDANQVATCFTAGPLETRILSQVVGKASALKMCFAAYTKGTTALLAAILAAAEAYQVREALERQWGMDGTDFARQTNRRVSTVTAKAWRFAGEMNEISETFAAAGLPGEFHAAASEIYRRMAGFKDASVLPALEEILAALLNPIRS